jgi:hypothetical protein
MTEQTDAAEVEALAAALFDAAFPGERESDPYWFQAYGNDWREHARRLAASDWLAAREAAARAEALREAADAWTQGAWSDVMLPKPTPPAVPVIAYSNRMGDWLRDRADSIARTDGAGS